jgi:hypothetical protein
MDTEIVQPQAGALVVADAPGAQPTPNKPAAVATPQTQTVEDVAALPEWAQKAIRDLRTESANHRKAKTAAEQAAALASEQSAIEQGKWKELYEKAKPQAERTAELEAIVTDLVAAEIANVPERFRALVPQGNAAATLTWIQEAKAAGLFAAPIAPRTDAATGAVAVVPGMLSDERRQEIATKYNLRLQDVPQRIGR